MDDIDKNNVVKSKRKRSSKACDACHKKKIKCNGNNPCKNCEDSKIPCVFSPRTKKRGPRAGYIGIMEKKLRSMESFLLDHGINCFSNQNNTDINLKVENGTNISTETNIIQPLSNKDKNTSQKNIEVNIKDTNEKEKVSKENTVNDNSEDSETEVIMPLIEIFFKSVNSHMPVIHKLSFYDKLKPVNRVSSLLLNAIYLVSVRYIDNPENYTPEPVLLKKVKLLLEKKLGQPSMETLQALIIMSVHFSGMSIGSSEWIYSGMAHRMAQILWYNCEISNRDEREVGPFEQEYRKRLWWICYLNDKYVSAFANRPLLIDENNAYLSLPIDSRIWETIKTDEEYEEKKFQQIYFKSELPYIPISLELNLFARNIILGALLGKVLTFKEHQREKVNHEYTITTDSDVTLLDTSLKNWFRSLPENINNVDKFDSDVKVIWLNSFLLVKYYTTLLLLHQPVIRKNAECDIDTALNIRNRWFSSPSYDTCMISVENITTILNKLINTNNITIISPYFIFCVFQSCIFILVNIINTKINSLEPDKKSENFLAIHLSLLLRIRDKWRIARIYLERFFEFCKFFNYNYEAACIANGIDPNPISLSYSQLTFNDTVMDNVIADSNWINFIVILNNIRNYIDSNKNISYFSNKIVEPTGLNMINNPRNLNNISSVSLKNDNSGVGIKSKNSSERSPNDFYYSTIPSKYQQTRRSIVIPKQTTSMYENSLKSSQSQSDSNHNNSNSPLMSISAASSIKSINISHIPQYSSTTHNNIHSNITLNPNENLNRNSSSLPVYAALPIHDLSSSTSSLYPQIPNDIITNSESFQQNNTSNLNYLYMPSNLINATTTQQNTQSIPSASYYNFINNSDTLTSLNLSNDPNDFNESNKF